MDWIRDRNGDDADVLAAGSSLLDQPREFICDLKASAAMTTPCVRVRFSLWE